MVLLQQVIMYLFPALMACAILYFAVGIVHIKYIKDYAKVTKGKEIAFTALASMFCILVLWVLVYSAVALFG